MTQISPFPLVDVSGSPGDRGKAYGEQARQRIAGSIALYSEQLGRLGFASGDVERFSDIFLPRLQAWASDLVVEMQGIAAGANVAISDVLLVNARTEVLQLARREKGVTDEDGDGCTGAVILPDATRDGRLLHGQNWDWRAECADTSIVLRIRRSDGPDILTFTEAGGLARSGFNSAGIGITANYLESNRDYLELGIPLPFIRRRALEANHFAHAIRVVATTPKSGSNNMMLSTAEGFAVDLECAPDEAFQLYPDGDMIVHANHWQSPVALSKLRETGLRDVPDSLYRDHRVRQRLRRSQGGVTMADLKEALFDDFGAPLSVCRPAVRKEGGNLSATVAMILFEPARGIMDIAPLPAECREFTRYELDMDEKVLAWGSRVPPAAIENTSVLREKRWSASS